LIQPKEPSLKVKQSRKIFGAKSTAISGEKLYFGKVFVAEEEGLTLRGSSSLRSSGTNLRLESSLE